MAKNPRKRTVVWIWGGFSAFLVSIVVVLIVITSSTQRKWRDMEAFLDKVRLERIRQTHVRIVASGKLLPGNAWDDYFLAEERAARFSREKPLTDFLDTGVDSPFMRNILARGEEALAHLHRGAQRSNGQYPYRWDADDGDIPLISRRQGLALLATTKARVLQEQGRVREAAGILVDVLTYTGDSGRNASLISAAIALSTYPRTLDEIGRVIDSGKLDREGMTQLAADLEALDRDFPRIGPAFVSEALGSGLVVRKHGGMPPFFPPKTRGGVSLTPVGTTLPVSLRPQVAGGRGARGQNSQTFTNIPEGKYSLVTGSAVRTGYIADIRQGGKSILDEGVITIGKEKPLPVEVVVEAGGGVIQGNVQVPAGTTATRGVIVSIPEGPRRQNSLLYAERQLAGIALRSTGPTNFSLQGITPGRYKVYAFMDTIPPYAEQNAAFMKPYESLAVTVDVTLDGTTPANIIVPLIPGK